jgi:gag-polyprotein putative aspartyl protease
VTEEIHDMSRVDSFMASRRRAMFFHSVWKPMLAGAVGAAIMSAAVIGSVWVILPKISTREVVVDHVIQREVPFDNHIPRDKPFDNYVPHSKPSDVPAPTPKPVASAPPMGPDSPYAPKTPDEKKFTDQPEYKDATYHGRIIKSTDGRSLSFEDGQGFSPAHWNPVTQKSESDQNRAFDSDEYVGDLGMCVPDKDHKELWECTAMHNGQVVDIHHKPYEPKGGLSPDKTTDAGPPTTAATNMVNVKVDVAGYPVEAMVDTGCSFPMSIPQVLADALIRVGRAVKAGSTPSMLADGQTQEVDVVLIKSITVVGRTLDTVEASVAPSNTAPILLGLGALNRLGTFKIEEGRLVFTDGQPA